MYKNIVDHMKRYERSKITDWTIKAKSMAARQMDSNILVVCVKTTDDIGECRHTLCAFMSYSINA